MTGLVDARSLLAEHGRIRLDHLLNRLVRLLLLSQVRPISGLNASIGGKLQKGSLSGLETRLAHLRRHLRVKSERSHCGMGLVASQFLVLNAGSRHDSRCLDLRLASGAILVLEKRVASGIGSQILNR